MKCTTPTQFQYTFKNPNGTIDRASATFASSTQIKLNPKSKTLQQQFSLVPTDPFIEKLSGDGFDDEPITMIPDFKCSPQCTTASPAWDGSPTWKTDTEDLHSAYATFTPRVDRQHEQRCLEPAARLVLQG